MWGEDWSYKASGGHLGQLADKAPPTTALLAGMGQNAGVVDIGQGYAVTFKLESHNHPSYVEPFQGAATGVGGIVRDILAMGARPGAVRDSLRVGPAAAAGSRRLRPGVQVGDRFRERRHTGCCVELSAAGLAQGVKAPGAAGVACATTGLAAGGGGGVGMRVRLAWVRRREASLGPAEILMSESQER